MLDNIKEKIFEEPQIFVFKCKITYESYNYSEYSYPEYIIKSYSYWAAFEKLQNEIQEILEDYDHEEFYDSDWEVFDDEINNNLKLFIDISVLKS